MKKAIIIFIAAVIMLSLCACAETGSTHTPDPATAEPANAATDAPVTTGAPSAPTDQPGGDSTDVPPDAPSEAPSEAPTAEPVKGSEGLVITDDGSRCIVTGIGTCTLSEIVIPSHVNGKPVELIDECAFQENKSITSVFIPGTVKKIDEDAFAGCTALASVTLSEGTETIGESAFYCCTALKSITIPQSVRWISGYAFRFCGLEEVTILGCSDIRSNAFAGCDFLKSFTVKNLGNETYQIMSNAFGDCRSLETLMLAPGLTEIGTWNFTDANNIKTVFLPRSLKKIGACSFLRSVIETVYYEGSESEWKAIEIKEPTFEPKVEYNSSFGN
ncbi:MAG: leucine-rich repeat protein [Clostridia bacterium]|nr:leucine-rich repeat protein [Clostridia bacterium]